MYILDAVKSPSSDPAAKEARMVRAKQVRLSKFALWAAEIAKRELSILPSSDTARRMARMVAERPALGGKEVR